MGCRDVVILFHSNRQDCPQGWYVRPSNDQGLGAVDAGADVVGERVINDTFHRTSMAGIKGCRACGLGGVCDCNNRWVGDLTNSPFEFRGLPRFFIDPPDHSFVGPIWILDKLGKKNCLQQFPVLVVLAIVLRGIIRQREPGCSIGALVIASDRP